MLLRTITVFVIINQLFIDGNCKCQTEDKLKYVTVSSDVKLNTNLKIIKLAFLGAYADLKFALGASLLAIEHVNADPDLLPEHKLEMMAVDVGSTDSKKGLDRQQSSWAVLAIRKMMEMKRKGAIVFIGPDGSSCSSEAIIAAAWNLPIISYACSDNSVSNKNVYHTFARTLPPSSKISKSVVSLLNAFDWRKFVLIAGKYPTWCKSVVDAVKVPTTAAHLYDAIKVYSKAATSVIRSGGDIANGTAILGNILNTKYHSIQGHDVRIDKNGDAEGNYSVIAVIQESNKSGIKSMNMQSVGYFQYLTNNTDELPVFRYYNESRTFQWVTGKKPDGDPRCGFDGEKCGYRLNWETSAITAICSFTIFVAFIFAMKHYRYEQKLACLLWKIDIKDIKLLNVPITKNVPTQNLDGAENARDCTISEEEYIPTNCPLKLGYYKGSLVVIRYVHKRTIDLTRSIRKELIQVRELRHENLVQIIGACVEPGNVCILMEYYARGSLQDVLMNYDIKLDQMFVSSLVADILRGIIYLHQSIIISHGNLRSSNCLIDSRWILRISDYGLHEFKGNHDDPNNNVKETKRKLYRAPELLRNFFLPRGTQKGDVYSFGILLYEIVGRTGPWGNVNMPDEEIIARIRNGATPFRPNTKILQTEKFIIDCMEKCWQPDPDQRPDFQTVREMLRDMHKGLKPNIFDNMLSIMEKYSYNLEELVRERTHQLSQEKKKTEKLLHEMLPPTVAELLKQGQRVIAESYDSVTIYFSDIVGFTTLSAISTPLQVVDLLNELYTTCDSILSQYDVYKVETIGDAYMVASGLPVRNEDRHAGEIASMALHLLNNVRTFKIKHIPNQCLKLRIGIHSGRCVAGVIGVRMPRYCLFGDTVNTASRMETNGQPMQIHISHTTEDLLRKLGGYYCVERGDVFIKGKGQMKTFWLVGEDPGVRQRRLTNTATSLQSGTSYFTTINYSE